MDRECVKIMIYAFSRQQKLIFSIINNNSDLINPYTPQSMSTFNDLPPEMIGQIMDFVTANDIKALRSVSRLLDDCGRELADDKRYERVISQEDVDLESVMPPIDCWRWAIWYRVVIRKDCSRLLRIAINNFPEDVTINDFSENVMACLRYNSVRCLNLFVGNLPPEPISLFKPCWEKINNAYLGNDPIRTTKVFEKFEDHHCRILNKDCEPDGIRFVVNR